MVTAGIALLARLPLSPPPPLAAGAAAEDFSAGRARGYVEILASEPRPTGSDAAERARARIVAWLAEIGVEAELQPATHVERRLPGWVRGAQVVNVLTRLEGTDPTGTLVLMSHYDSVQISPGAADDAAGVAVLLETVRALRAGPRPRNDVLFLFTDGEEVGRDGAAAFLSRHQWASDVELVLNFEARGASGPSILFETGPVDADLMRTVGRVAPRPLAYSYSADVYRRLPNDTDFTPFRRSGIAGFNFAFIGDSAAYHSALDTPERLDPASLQHHGTWALALARHFADADLGRLPERGGAVYFHVPLAGLVAYPTGWALPLAALAALAALALIASGLLRGRLRLPPLISAVALVPIVVAITAAAVYFGEKLLRTALGLDADMFGGVTGYLVGWALLAIAGAAGMLALLARRLGALPTATAGVAWWSAAAVATALLLPASSYLFVWPLTLAMLPMAPLLAAPSDHGAAGGRRPALAVLLLVSPIGAVLLWVPSVILIGAALGPNAAVVAGAAAGLSAILIAPLLLELTTGRRWPAVAAAGIGAVLVAATALGAGYDAERPRPGSLFYALDATSGEAFWASFVRTPDGWSGAVLEGAERRSLDGWFFRSYDVLAKPAPPLPLEPVRVEPMPGAEGGTTLRLVPPAGTAELRVVLRPAGELRLAAVGGEPVERSGHDPVEEIELTFHAPPPDGLDLELAEVSAESVEVLTVAHLHGLPEPAGRPLPPRPPELQPARRGITDRVLVRHVAEVPLRAPAEPQTPAPDPAPH